MGRDFKNIKAWQYADDLAVLAYSASKSFPKSEIYGITSQLRRAAVSVPANIAEGASREHKKEYLHSLYVARGSMAETEYLLYLARRLGYLAPDQYEELESARARAAKTLHGLVAAVEKEATVGKN
ncbi:MAG TPA: four helix bundle protein [Sedimentisphaerales bacterium]|nr:four helix bundle protein [Sedimentisphaerales bacterium]